MTCVFLPAEAAKFLELEGDQNLTAEHFRHFQERSEGWIVGLKLLSMSLRADAEPFQLLEGATGERRQIADFFSEDVVSRQTRELQNFCCTPRYSSASAAVCATA